jgi:periplasmic divalent cation tolerance protein
MNDNMEYANYETGTLARVVLVTCPEEAVAARLAHALVERRLAACVTRIPGAVSVYRWQGEIEEANEVQLIIKTGRERVVELFHTLNELHPDDEPEAIVLDVGGGSAGYLGWVVRETTMVET